MIVDFSGNYLNAKTVVDGSIYEIADEGIPRVADFNGRKADVFDFKVIHEGKQLIWTPTNAQGNAIVKAWGNDSKTWIGKKFQVFKVEDKMIVKPLK